MQQRLLFSFIYKKAHSSEASHPRTEAFLWNRLIDGATDPGRVGHKVIFSDVQHCWVYKQPNGIKSPCSAALSRKLLRLKSVFLEARYCINLWRGGEKERRRKELVSYLMVFPDSTQSCPHRHNRNEEFVLNDRLFRVWRLKNSRSHAGNQLSNTDNAAGEKPTKIVFSSVFTFHFGSAWVRVARLERWLQASFGSSCTNINKINEQ